MYNILLDIVKNDLNRRISEPADLDLLKKIANEISGMRGYIKIIGSSTLYPDIAKGATALIKNANYAGRIITIQIDDTKIQFPCTGVIVTAQEIGLSLFFPNSEQPGVNLILLVTDED